MRILAPIDAPLADEHVIATDPPLRPDLPGVWRRRINPFTGRALSDRALTAEQDARAGMQRLRGQAVSAGIVSGLDVMAEPGAVGRAPAEVRMQILPGSALARSGEDIAIANPRRIALADLPVWARVDHLDAIEPGAAPGAGGAEEVGDAVPGGALPGGVLEGLAAARPRRVGPALGRVLASPAASALPRVAVLLAEPVTAVIRGRAGGDDCPPDPRDAAYDDLQRIDGCRLVLAFWPAEMTARRGGPDYSLPAGPEARRNRLAHRIFAIERAMVPGEMHPWERRGVPLALVAFRADWTLDFIDRAAVARMGGQPRPRTPLVPQSGEPGLWQARIAQFVEHLASLPDLAPATLLAAFRQVPPVGFLPASVIDVVTRRQGFFPAGFTVRAAPVPLEQVDRIVRESAALVPINLDAADEVELLLPVPDRVFEPGLLETAVVDPAFLRAIARYRADRTHWLIRRETVRRRREVLADAASGRRPAWPAADRAAEETLPDDGRAPVLATRLRPVAAGTGPRSLRMVNAGSSLDLAEGDSVFVWLRVADATGLGGIAVQLGVGTDAAGGGDFSRGVFWGALDRLPVAAGNDAGATRRRGGLPAAGGWTRLDIPADAAWQADGGKASGIAVNGLVLAQLGGTVEWGPVGKRDAEGNETVWIADEAPPEAVLSDSAAAAPGWPDIPASAGEAAEEGDFGTIVAGGTRASATLAGFRARWPQAFLTSDFRDLQERGIDGFIGAVEARMHATNDAIDLGFVRARADIYRVRQYMLGADAAARLVTSPALADLAVREEGARAKSLDLSAFVRAAYQTDFRRDPSRPLEPRPLGAPPVPATPQPATPSPSAGGGGGGAGGVRPQTVGGFSRGALSASRFSAVAAPVTAREMDISSTMLSARVARPAAQPMAVTAIPAAEIAAAVQIAAAQPGTARPVAGRPGRIAPELLIERAGGDGSVEFVSVAAAAAARRPSRVSEVQGQLPLPGAVERTASVAERLKPSPAVEAHTYALAGKVAIINAVTALLAEGAERGRPRGIALGDLPALGYRLKPGSPPPAPGREAETLADLIARPGMYADTDELPDNIAKHEADYFTASVSAIDNTIAVMRLIEGRVDLYNRLLGDARQVQGQLAQLAAMADARLRAIEVELAEARHDLAVADGLLAEETARVAALNQRRADILRQHAVTVLFRRARRARPGRAVASIAATAAAVEAPATLCLRAHDDAPEELAAYTSLFRDAPVAWFPALAGELRRIDRLEAARAALAAVRRRAVLAVGEIEEIPGDAPPRLLAAARQAMLAQRRALAGRRLAALHLDAAAVAQADLSLARGALAEHASLGDLIEGAHNRPALARLAAAEIEAIGQVAACLHESFTETPPALRLAWAEVLSEFDQPAPLAQLTGLADWISQPAARRRTQQGLVDWLFGRIDRANTAAEAAMNEMVRIALLLAAHAPVDRIVPARLVAPAPARVGTRLDLVLDARLARIGMAALVRGADAAPLAEAVIDDLGEGVARARITRVFAKGAEIAAAGIATTARIELGARALR